MIRHNCAIVKADTVDHAYRMLQAQQHRGRETAGIVGVRADGRIDGVKWLHTVDRFSLDNLRLHFSAECGYVSFLAHDRYATRGSKNAVDVLRDAHPHVIGGELIHHGNHVLIRGASAAIVHNGQVDERYLKEVPSANLRTSCDSEALLHFYWKSGGEELMRHIPGAYTLAIADSRRSEIIVMRDRTGIRPGVLGQTPDGKFGVASEDSAFARTGGSFVCDLKPGVMYLFNRQGRHPEEREIIATGKLSECFFEWNYVAHKLSTLHGNSVFSIRQRLGEKLAEEWPLERLACELSLRPELVTFVPHCPEPAGKSYAEKVGLPFVNVFYKINDERSFLGSTPEARSESISQNLFFLPDAAKKIRGKIVIANEDSIIRGNVVRRATDLFRKAGVKTCIFASYTPEIGIIGADNVPRGCEFGIDMPVHDNFIARSRTREEISDILGVPIVYLSRKGMLEVFSSFNLPEKKLCTYCIGGEHPFKRFDV